MTFQQVFTSISSPKIAALITTASEKIVLVMPAFSDKVVNALLEAIVRIGQENVTIVIDCDEEVFRLGYGDFKAVQQIHDSGVHIRQCSGLRIGVLVIDHKAWIFSPTALYVQDEVQSDETPNSIQLADRDIDRLIQSLVPNALEGQPQAEIEIGNHTISDVVLKKTGKSLELAPPVAFNIARQVRVFQPYIQYVEINLKGCSIQNKRIQIPKSMQGLEKNKEIEDRLRTTFELIEKNSTISSRDLEKALDKIREHFTPSLGNSWGRVILKAARATFDERIEEFKAKLEEHRKTVKDNLKEYLEKSKKQVVDYYYPLIKKNPPDAVIGKTLFAEQDQEKVLKNWLIKELERNFPTVENLLTEMKLDVQFRDVTYETLKEEGFGEALRRAYPDINWEKPFNEFNAAEEREN